MNCPTCNTPGAYVGAFVVECPKLTCRHYNHSVAKTFGSSKDEDLEKIQALVTALSAGSYTAAPSSSGQPAISPPVGFVFKAPANTTPVAVAVGQLRRWRKNPITLVMRSCWTSGWTGDEFVVRSITTGIAMAICENPATTTESFSWSPVTIEFDSDVIGSVPVAPQPTAQPSASGIIIIPAPTPVQPVSKLVPANLQPGQKLLYLQSGDVYEVVSVIHANQDVEVKNMRTGSVFPVSFTFIESYMQPVP